MNAILRHIYRPAVFSQKRRDSYAKPDTLLTKLKRVGGVAAPCNELIIQPLPVRASYTRCVSPDTIEEQHVTAASPSRIRTRQDFAIRPGG